MKRNTRFAALILAGLLLGGALLAGTAARAHAGPGAVAAIKDAQGQVVGDATLTELSTGGVRIQVQLHRLTAVATGEHGIHIHAVGQCTDAEFKAAGGHFNPTNAQHGLNNPQGAHGGDLPNLQVNADGSASYEVTDTRVTLATGAPNSLFDADGSALVIHAGPDDLMTDPAGNSGARIACGVITAAAVGMPATGGSPLLSTALWLIVLAAPLLALGWLARRLARQRVTG